MHKNAISSKEFDAEYFYNTV